MSKLALKLIAENKKTRATFLDLGNCGLTEVPDEIGDLVWLEELLLVSQWWGRGGGREFCTSKNKGAANNITKLCNNLGELKKLKKLWLDGDHGKKSTLNDLSPLADLYNLQKLDACDTQVTDLSPLAGLHNLQELRVIRTSVTDLSPLAGLHNLKCLNIYDAQVKDLSPLMTLSNLQDIVIGGAHITDIKPLAELHNLRRIYVMKAAITDLSPLLYFIENHLEVNWISAGDDYSQEDGIYIGDCPLTNPPIAIVKQGNAAILNYFKEKESQGVDHLYEAKLLLVGAGGAGKSSLLRRLYQPELKDLLEESETTKGIAIHRHEFEMKDSRYPEGRVFRLNVWDFGGQEKYRPTDTFFFTQRSLYVLLDDTRNDDKTVHDASFKYWLEAVDLLSDNSPVLIFQNEKGGRSKNIDLAGIKGKFDNVKHCYSGNLEHANAADALRREIETCALNLPHIGEELPKQWLAIRAAIEKQAGQHATISQEKYFSLYKKHLPFDRAKALHLSHYLHDLGVFLHFQDDDLLARTVILQNQWATEAVFKMLDDEQVKADLGRFTNTDCVRMWQDSVYADMHPELLALMQKFELCYLLPDTTPKKWLAPQLLPPSKPLALIDWAKSGDLVLRFRYEFLPKGLISRLMVRLHRFVPIPELAWLTGVLFERNEAQVLVEIPPKGGEIMLRARGFEHKELLSVIAADLDALNATFKGLPEKVTKLIPCDCEFCRQQIEPESFEQPELLRRKKMGKSTIECRASFENVNVLQLLDGVQVNKIPDWSKEDSAMKKIFISYSKKDNRYKKALINHLQGLRGKIITWNDSDLLAGEDWGDKIKEELNASDIVLYLVSANSIATDYIQKIELPLIQERCENGECKLVPIIVSACHWTALDFAKKNALPNKGVAVRDKSWGNQDEAWATVVKQLEKIV